MSKEVLQQIIDQYAVEDILNILGLGYGLENEDLWDMDVEDVVRLYRKKILSNLELFDIY